MLPQSSRKQDRGVYLEENDQNPALYRSIISHELRSKIKTLPDTLVVAIVTSVVINIHNTPRECLHCDGS
jgi:hypothetical protein